MKKLLNVVQGIILALLIIFLGLLMGSRYAQQDDMIYDAVTVVQVPVAEQPAD